MEDLDVATRVKQLTEEARAVVRGSTPIRQRSATRPR